ncbi:MAG TPA: hypothetical protein VL576_02345 [Candidatus Paceibacterota bacterium]|jgi:hypothetical protein|nr:hypothetical protein [Candidatus Paceibacterota bacterium]
MKTKTYRLPTISAYFTNISAIDKLAVLHDAPIDVEVTELQMYFNDLYQVLLHRLSEYAITDSPSTKDEDKLVAMFLEFIKTKHALHGGSDTDRSLSSGHAKN